MILDHIADGAGFLVEFAAAADVEVLRHRDLHAADVVAIPDRLEKRVGEARIENVLHRLLAQVMIDAEDRLFGKVLVQDAD